MVVDSGGEGVGARLELDLEGVPFRLCLRPQGGVQVMLLSN